MRARRTVRGAVRHAVTLLLFSAASAAAQSNGSIVGRVLDAQSKQPCAGVDVRVLNLPHRTVSDASGRFVVGAVPPGEREVRAELIGYKPVVMERVHGAALVQGLLIQAGWLFLSWVSAQTLWMMGVKKYQAVGG